MNAQTVGNLNSEASKLFRIRKTCFKMLRKRGYAVESTDLEMTTEQFQFLFEENRARAPIKVRKNDDPEDQLYVFFPDGDKGGDKSAAGEKIGVTHLKTYFTMMNNDNVKRAIIIVKNNLTPFAKQLIKEVSLRGKASIVVCFQCSLICILHNGSALLVTL